MYFVLMKTQPAAAQEMMKSLKKEGSTMTLSNLASVPFKVIETRPVGMVEDMFHRSLIKDPITSLAELSVTSTTGKMSLLLGFIQKVATFMNNLPENTKTSLFLAIRTFVEVRQQIEKAKQEELNLENRTASTYNFRDLAIYSFLGVFLFGYFGFFAKRICFLPENIPGYIKFPVFGDTKVDIF